MENRKHKDDGMLVHCPACGEYVVTDCDRVNLQSERLRSQWNAAHLSALLREQTIRRLPPFWLRYGMDPYGPLKWEGDLTPMDLDELLTRWPKTVPERIDRTRCNLAACSQCAGSIVECLNDDPAIAFANTAGEARFHLESLDETGFLKLSTPLSIGVSEKLANVVVTAKGWARVTELTRGRSPMKSSTAR